MLKSFTKAIRLVETVVAVMLFFVLLCNQEIGQRWLGWEGIDPRYAWLPIGVVAAHLFLKANYEKYQELEQSKDGEIDQLRVRIEQTLQQSRGDTAAAVRETIRRAVKGEYSEEWRAETRNMLRGAMDSTYVREFDLALWGPQPESSSKHYLKGLESRLDGALLRDSRVKRKQESDRLNAALDMIWELKEREPQLNGRFTSAVRNSVIDWRKRCVITLQELLRGDR